MSHIKYLVYHHLGLGDHIICNGLIRYLVRHNPNVKIELAVKQRNLNNVSRMFNDCDISFKIIDNTTEKGNLGWMFGGDKEINFDEAFYKQAGIDFSERWKSFYVNRNYEKEKTVLDYLNTPLEFALVHNTASAGKVDIKPITNLPIIEMRYTPVEESIFDWMGVIERATEIHCINSSFIHLVDSMSPKAKLHFYNDRPQLPFSRKLKWTEHK